MTLKDGVSCQSRIFLPPKGVMSRHTSTQAHFTGFTCPDCAGVLSLELENNRHRDYRCQVGHHFSTKSLLFAKEKEVERILWAAAALLEHVMQVYERMEHETKQLNGKDRRRLQQRIAEAKKQKHLLVRIVESTHAWE